MDKKDLYIKAKLQEDKEMSNKANEIFKKFEGGINLENNNKPKERKVIKLSLNQAVLAFTSLMIVFILGGNLYAHLNGKPNLYSAIKNLFIKEAKYTESEIIVDQTVESNGIKLTLKTVAMDENVLITKYVAEGEKLANEIYTYPEFEDDILFYINPENRGGKNSEELLYVVSTMSSRLGIYTKNNIEAQKIIDKAIEAYTEYTKAVEEADDEKTTNAKKKIEEVIVLWEQLTKGKQDIIEEDTKLQNFNAEIISQKIERSGNQYIIYNVYNVDTISDLANEFKLNVNITKIGSTSGKWNFETKLEKARLDTRVETIDFYGNETDVYGNDKDGYIKVSVKKLVISDFSSVLMVQKNSDYYMDGSTESLLKNTYTYVVTDENDNVLGTGGTVKAENVYADRIILDNVDINTKILKVKIYSNIDNELLKTITIDIEEARQEKHVELNQTLYNASHGISLQYPGSWTQPDKVSVDQEVGLLSPADVDGEVAWIGMERMLVEDIENGKIDLGDPDEFEDVVKSSIEVSGYTGDNYVYTYAEDMKERQIRVVKDDAMYFIRYRGNLTQFERYNKTFEEILKTVSFIEVKEEKSYRMVSNGGRETLKLYEDNTLTISFSEEALQKFGDYEGGKEINIKANTEYTISGTDDKNIIAMFIGNGYPDYYGIPRILLVTVEGHLYYANVIEGLRSEQFVLSGVILTNVDPNKTQSQVLVREDEQGYIPSTIVYTQDGTKYMVTTNLLQGGVVTAEKYKEYIEPTEKDNEQENNSNNQQTQNNEQYTILYDKDICTVKQYERNKRITVEWKDTDYDYQEIKYGSIKTNNEYTITGMQGPVKNVFIIHKDRQDQNLPGILFWCENNKIYYVRWDIVHSDSAINILWEHDNITEISQTSGTWLDAKQGQAACTITYMGLKYNQSITDAQAKETIQTFLDLYGARDNSPLMMLQYDGILKLGVKVDYNNTILENDHEYIYTGVKFKDFQNKMFKYMTKDIYVKEFSRYYKDVNGALYAENISGSGIKYQITNIEHIEGNDEYRVNVNQKSDGKITQATITFKLIHDGENVVVSLWGVG